MAFDFSTMRRALEEQSAGQAQTVKTFSDRLKERRGFVQGNAVPADQISDKILQSGIIGGSAPMQDFLKVGEYGGRLEKQALDDLTNAQNQQATTSDQLFKLGLSENDQANADRQYGLDSAKAGLTVDPETGKLVVAPKVDITGKPIPRGADAVAEVKSQGGEDLFKGLTTAGERAAISEDILESGGVIAYRKQLPEDKLFSTDELKARGLAVALLKNAGESVTAIDNGGAGLGWQGYLPGKFITPEGTLNRASVGDLTAAKMKEISGAVISEPEVRRLAQFLPTKTDTDAEIKIKADRLYKGTAVGLEMQKLAKINGLLLEDAYVKFAEDVYPKYGEEIPEWVKKLNGATNSGSQPSGVVGTLDEEDEALIKSYLKSK